MYTYIYTPLLCTTHQPLQVIRDSQSENKVEASDKLHIRAQFPKAVENNENPGVALPANLVPLYSGLGAGANTNDGPYVKILVRLYLSYSADRPATNVSLTIEAPGFAHVVPKNIILAKVSGVKTTPLMVKVYFYATKNCLPTGLGVVVTASYLSHNGEPRVTSIPLVSYSVWCIVSFGLCLMYFYFFFRGNACSSLCKLRSPVCM